jgi:hypothetical protein
MRRFGQLLMLLGAGVGLFVGLAIALHLHLTGASWLIDVGLSKLGLIASCGIMAAGAGAVRLANRQAHRERLRSGERVDTPL